MVSRIETKVGIRVERASDPRVSRRYRILPEKLGETQLESLFPALAIPVEAKQEYECPDDHLQALNECLPKITKLLVIGWRASEDQFLDLLVKNLQKDVRVVAPGRLEFWTNLQ